MKTIKGLILILLLLSLTVSAQTTYNVSKTTHYVKRSTTSTASPTSASFGSTLTRCWSTIDNVWYKKSSSGVVSAEYVMYPYAAGEKVIYTPTPTIAIKYPSSYQTWYIKVSTTKGKLPLVSDFSTTYTYCYNSADSIVYKRSGNTVVPAYIRYPYKANPPPATTCIITYSEWSTCAENGTQTRTILSVSPSGCTPVNPVLTQSCTYVPPLCTGYSYSAWSSCIDGVQTRTVIDSFPQKCYGGEAPVLTQSCVVAADSCIYTYSAWGACRADSTQVRTIISTLPNGCVGTPDTIQRCNYIAPTCSYTYSNWTVCDQSGKQYRTVTDSIPSGCYGLPVLVQNCTYIPPACSSHTYTTWSSCEPNNTQTRTVISSLPTGCAGGVAPVLVQSCTYTSSVKGRIHIKTTGLDANAGTNASPYLTLNKAISVANAGDTIYIHSGTYNWGAVQTISKSGSNGAPILIAGYPNETTPVITGLQTITGWNNEGSGIYSKAITAQSTPNMVVFNGVNKPLARFPKTGYNKIDAATSTSLTDADLNGSLTNYLGATVVIRKHYFIIDRCTVTAHSGQSLVFTNPSSYSPMVNWGYFIENHLSCLTVLGDWIFSGGKIYMYFGTNNPVSYTVQVSTLDKLVLSSSKNYITFRNLSFSGANNTALDLVTCDNITVDSCSFKFHGKDGIKVSGGSDNTLIMGSVFEDIHNNGLFVATYRGATNNTVIRRNTFNRCALYAGMGGDGDLNGVACYLGCDNSLIEYNTVYQCGFNGIQVDATYTNVVIRKNHLRETNSIKSDGGSIYLFEANYTSAGGLKIYDNIVLNTLDSYVGTNGTNKLSHGIYLDGRTQSVEMYNNTCADVRGAGFLIGAWTRNIDMGRGNTLYNNEYGMRILRWTPETAYPNITIKNTKSFANSSSQYNYLFECTSSFPNNPSGIQNWINNIGTVDSNYYGKASTETTMSIIAGNTSYLYKTFATWKMYEPALDIHSTNWTGLPASILFDYNATWTNKTVTGLTGWKSVLNVSVTSYTLAPYKSIILIK